MPSLPAQTATVDEYERHLTQLVQDFSLRRRLTLEKAALRPAITAYRPECPDATRVRMDFLVAEISRNLFGALSPKYGLDEDGIGLLANTVLEAYGHEVSASGFVVFSKTFLANRIRVGGLTLGYYDELYSRVDTEVILSGLRRYIGYERKHRERLLRVDEVFIQDLPRAICEMADAEIVALAQVGTVAQQVLIRSIVSNWLNSGLHPGIPALADYIHKPRF